MPAYNTLNPPPALMLDYPNNRALVFKTEAVTSGEFSQQVSLPLAFPAAGGGKGIRVEGDFSAAPGTFEFDIMESDSDKENGSAGYNQVPSSGAITATVSGSATHFATGLIPFAGQFCCIFVKTQPSNPVTVSLRISRAT